VVSPTKNTNLSLYFFFDAKFCQLLKWFIYDATNYLQSIPFVGIFPSLITLILVLTFIMLTFSQLAFYFYFLFQVFAFDRTISRLLEMQSEEYLRTATERYPVESGGSEWLYRELCDTTVESTSGRLFMWILIVSFIYDDKCE
jgi:hypothetical protein